MADVELELATDRMIARRSGPVGWLIFNHVQRHNAVSLEMWEAIPTIVDAFETDPEVRVVVVTGAGRDAFVAGADISEFEQQRSGDGVARYDARSSEASARLAQCTKPTLAAIDGFCLGGGVGIALCCDLRFATRRSRFAIPAARLGLGYGVAGVRNLMNVVGPAYAKELFYTARQFDGDEANQMGLVNRLVDDDALDATVDKTCRRIAENAPLTLHAVKATVDALGRHPHAPDVDRCEALVQACFESDDYVEGRRAFMEKRRPVFQGR